MANSIRTPRQGLSATSREIAEAVDNEDWQLFRLSMKGKSTADKLEMLYKYYDTEHEKIDGQEDVDKESREHRVINVRVYNYLKALARGGQIAVSTDYEKDFLEHTIQIRR